MKRTFALLLTLCLWQLCPLAQDATDRKIVAYVTSWSSIMPDPKVMTHINYAFGGVGDDAQSVYADNTSRMQNIINLKKKNPRLKVMLSIGGWGRGKFTPMAKDETKRKAFAKACRAFCDKYKLDGIDIDWEFPGNNSSGETSPSNEKQNFTLLMRDLREALGTDLQLTMASSSDPGYYDFKSCIQYLDFVNVMTYDMSGPPNHHSALYRGGKVGNGWLVQHESIQKHLKAGIPASKLVMGLAFYGNSGAGSQISLQEIKNGIASGKWTDHWDDVAKVPYVTDKNGTFAYGYDDDRSLTIKCQYIQKYKLAGAMYWEYANDDNKGTERTTVYNCIIGTERKGLTFGQQELKYEGNNLYTTDINLEQGAIYQASGATEMLSDAWYIDPDFFAREADGGLRFLPVSGRYRVVADFFSNSFRITPLNADGQPLGYNTADGSGCIWVMGATSSIGKPTYADGDDAGWSEENAFAMAPISSHRYQMTLEVGKQLNPSLVNFKFFHQPKLGTDAAFTYRGDCRITTTNRIFAITTTTTENGNIKLRSGKTIKEGETYVFTIDTSDPLKATLILEDLATGISETFPLHEEPAPLFDLTGQRATSPRRGNIYIQPSSTQGAARKILY